MGTTMRVAGDPVRNMAKGQTIMRMVIDTKVIG